MSSEERRFSTRVVPVERAARRRQRLERDLEPGRVMVPERFLIGVILRVLVASSMVGMEVVDIFSSWCELGDGVNRVWVDGVNWGVDGIKANALLRWGNVWRRMVADTMYRVAVDHMRKLMVCSDGNDYLM